MEAKDRIIVALDVDTLEETVALVQQLYDYAGLFKVGLQLLMNEGAPEVIGNIKELGAGVFCDGKFCDIPNTVAGASRAVARLGVDMFNVHASGGIEMMRAAVENKGESKVLAVTVLTSLSEDDAHLIYGQPSKAKVMEFARWAKIAGVDGSVSSPKELEVLGKCKELNGLLRVTPGVRPEWAAKGDQKRVMTPAEAIKAGADYLVIGRPITNPPKEIGSPVDAAKKIAEEIAEVLKDKGGD